MQVESLADVHDVSTNSMSSPSRMTNVDDDASPVVAFKSSHRAQADHAKTMIQVLSQGATLKLQFYDLIDNLGLSALCLLDLQQVGLTGLRRHITRDLLPIVGLGGWRSLLPFGRDASRYDAAP